VLAHEMSHIRTTTCGMLLVVHDDDRLAALIASISWNGALRFAAEPGAITRGMMLRDRHRSSR